MRLAGSCALPQPQDSVRLTAVLTLMRGEACGKDEAWPEPGRDTVLAGHPSPGWGWDAASALMKLGLGLRETKGEMEEQAVLP